jgi:hypothetical protein
MTESGMKRRLRNGEVLAGEPFAISTAAHRGRPPGTMERGDRRSACSTGDVPHADAGSGPQTTRLIGTVRTRG